MLLTAALSASTTTAVLYYMGWSETSSYLGHMGIPFRVMNYSITDYLLLSINTLRPLAFGSSILIFLIVALLPLTGLPDEDARSRPSWAALAAATLCALIPLLIFAFLVGMREIDYWTWLLLFPTVFFLPWVARGISGKGEAGKSLGRVRLSQSILLAIVVLTAAGQYGEQMGRNEAQTLIAGSRRAPRVLLWESNNPATLLPSGGHKEGSITIYGPLVVLASTNSRLAVAPPSAQYTDTSAIAIVNIERPGIGVKFLSEGESQ